MNMLFRSTALQPPAPIPRLPPPAALPLPAPACFPLPLRLSPDPQFPRPPKFESPHHPSLAFPALPMPSKRPSPHAAMDAAARLRPSPPRSKKRSSRAKPRAGDRRRSPNPNPSSRRDHGASAPSRKSDRKRKLRSFADSASLAMAIAAPASSGSGGGHVPVQQKLWTDADEVALLTGAAAFRARHGAVPRLPDMGALFESLRGSLSPHLDQAKVYYKLKRLKSKFLHSAAAATSSPHEHRVRDLSADLWGAELAPPVEDDAEAEEGDADEGYVGGEVAVRLPVVSEVLGEYWRRNARALSGVSLEKGLALLRAGEGRVVETKWRRQLDAEMRTQVRQHDLATEVYGLLIDAVKGLGP